MAYQPWSVVFGETPSASKWNILGSNDQGFNDGTAIGTGAITTSQILDGTILPADLAATARWWEELGRITVGTAGPTFTVSFTAKKYLHVIINQINSGANATGIRFNGDSGNNYADSYSLWDGNANGTDLSQNFMPVFGLTSAAGDKIKADIFIDNNTGTVKNAHSSGLKSTSSAGAAPVPEDVWEKWANTSSQINSITYFDRGSVNLAVGTELIVLGHD